MCLLKIYFKRGIFVSYVNPVKMLSSDDLPAPDGPIIAVSSPERNWPEILSSTIFVSNSKKVEKILILYKDIES